VIRRFRRFFPLSVALGLGLLASLFWGAAARAQTDDAKLDYMRALAHSRLGVQVLLNQGQTLLYGPTRRTLEAPGAEGLRPFGGLAGSRQEVSGNGRTTMNGYSFLAGLGQRLAIQDSLLAAFSCGFFGEGGTGRFETSRTFASGDTRGEGRSRYAGGGVLLGTELVNGVHMDGAFRIGQAVTALEELDTSFAGGWPESSNSYLGAGGTLGWRTPLGESLGLDFYGRLLWGHQAGGASRTFGRDEIKADEINSTQLMLGSRADFQVGRGWLVYAGAAWDYEFNGRAELALNAKREGGPYASLKGGSLMGEAGLELAGEGGFSARLGVEGAGGRREALGGVLRLLYEF